MLRTSYFSRGIYGHWPAKPIMSTQEPQRISVALCTYNGEHFIQQQLDSIARQTRLPYELVICDDRSTDRTLEIIANFVAQVPFPVSVHVNPEQLGSTRNFDKAMRLCRGEYIALCDQDDRWRSDKLSRLGELLDRDPTLGVVFSDASLINDASAIVGASLWKAFHFGGREQMAFQRRPGDLMMRHNVVTGATVLLRRSLLDHFAEVPRSWVHDAWLVWMGIFWMKVLAVDEPLTEYRLHASQQLGIGGGSIRMRLRMIRNKQRDRYRAVTREFEDLLAYVEKSGTLLMQESWSDALREKIRFFRARGAAPAGLVGRIGFIAREAANYGRFDRRRTMLKDLFLGEENA